MGNNFSDKSTGHTSLDEYPSKNTKMDILENLYENYCEIIVSGVKHKLHDNAINITYNWENNSKFQYKKCSIHQKCVFWDYDQNIE